MIKQHESSIEQLNDLEFMAVASSEEMDRDGDVIPVKSWDLSRFEQNPVILWGHDQKIPAIARAKKIWKDLTSGQLKIHVEFPPAGINELSDTIRKLVKAGFINALSVGFLGKDYDSISSGKKYNRTELLEVSLVNCPANAQALIQARDVGLITQKDISILESAEPFKQEVERLLRKKLIEMGYDPDSTNIPLKHWEIDDLIYDIRKSVQSNMLKTQEKELEIYKPAPGYVAYDFRGATMAEIAQKAKIEEELRYNMRRCF